ncbi:lysylphosphatidylglycerol synthase transmembrane domain-containing protein [Haloarcula nitratireducens]|uniref:Flippase-like domain-containing protein n=1 Tax=Haloarcula nitratireducens TaxID=2487749 RepID=A0AAW4PIX0_9EURY|nr:lysylphosphatidylglycerol synthase transmembrane domain-containing protein [Halomicroarcula nitratireducens]MBX0297901.1 flippase-like domain-containing protein [Halomicroarcula nitratireducens]
MPDSSGFDRRTLAKIGVGFLAAVMLVYLAGWVVGWNRILSTLAGANYWWVALGCLSSTACLVVWAKAWDEVLDVLDVSIPYRALIVTYFAATFADYVTPFGKVGGNPFIAYLLSQDDRISYEESLAGIVTADLLNLVPFFVFSGVGLAALSLFGSVPSAAKPLIGGLSVVAVAVPLSVYGTYQYRNAFESVLTTLLSPVASWVDSVDVDSIRQRLEEFYARIDRIASHRGVLVSTLSYSFVGWLFFALPLYLAGQAVGVHIDPLLVLFLVPASSLAGIAPTPGGVGGIVVVLAALMVALVPMKPSTAAAVALLYRVASYWFVIAISGIATFYEIYRA